MVLAAGLGTRMRPLTEARPKPLLPLAGRTLLDHALDRIDEAGIGNVVVNAHWFPDRIEEVCAARPQPPRVVAEDTLLETGGGVRNALPLLGEDPFLVVNGDAYWMDGPVSTIARLAGRFDPETMDGLLLMVRASQVDSEIGHGDFLLDPLGRVRWPKEREVSPYVFGGLQIVHPRLMEGSPEGSFSMREPWSRAIEAGRLYGLVHDGAWFHLSRPGDLRVAEAALATGLTRALF
ncbi:nucleotidyltransferase family protein [Roseomonas marmotae]|uniref:Nucleotidyltransferase family protein n=2 Tax=Roseomonas marmotae TaxID=2768161 RepID=A0ABS3KCH7_9PROT|nr:nucleotidyltransferase family protein [Roseomonas marmotae]MBO1075173.1 nucleotidyltransferase family protein [Roseomonas marmotae]QTI80787.1 nucleotidyltransferase family protein [Roseomonas marmotae]